VRWTAYRVRRLAELILRTEPAVPDGILPISAAHARQLVAVDLSELDHRCRHGHPLSVLSSSIGRSPDAGRAI
jgi:hypothetical protein